MTKKLTKKDHFNHLLKIEEVKTNPVLVAFIEHEIELLNKKNSTATGEKKLTANQKANEELKVVILGVLKAHEEPMTITEMMKADETLGGLTNQKISAIIRQMIKEETVERREDKKKAMFTVK
jgi:GDP-D-mannose dehydratase